MVLSPGDIVISADALSPELQAVLKQAPSMCPICNDDFDEKDTRALVYPKCLHRVCLCCTKDQYVLANERQVFPACPVTGCGKRLPGQGAGNPFFSGDTACFAILSSTPTEELAEKVRPQLSSYTAVKRKREEIETYVHTENERKKQFVERALKDLLDKAIVAIRSDFEEKLQKFMDVTTSELQSFGKTTTAFSAAETMLSSSIIQQVNIESKPEEERMRAHSIYDKTMNTSLSAGRLVELTRHSPTRPSQFDMTLNPTALQNLFQFSAVMDTPKKLHLTESFKNLKGWANAHPPLDYILLSNRDVICMSTRVRRLTLNLNDNSVRHSTTCKYDMTHLSAEERATLSMGFVSPDKIFIYRAGQMVVDCFSADKRLGKMKGINLAEGLDVSTLVGLGDGQTFLSWNKATNTLRYMHVHRFVMTGGAYVALGTTEPIKAVKAIIGRMFVILAGNTVYYVQHNTKAVVHHRFSNAAMTVKDIGVSEDFIVLIELSFEGQDIVVYNLAGDKQDHFFGFPNTNLSMPRIIGGLITCLFYDEANNDYTFSHVGC